MSSGNLVTDDTMLGSNLAPRATPARLPRLLPGSSIGSYEIVGHLGAGAMGTVYRAHDRAKGRDVAVKLRLPAADGKTSCRLQCSLLGREAQVMAQLSHPNVVGIFDVGQFRGCVFLALELVEGTTLREWASGRSREARLTVLVDAGIGLAAAHRAGIVHRDFKPENVLVSHTGQAKVADFGLARSVSQILAWGVECGGCGTDEAAIELANTVDESLAGTLRYMAPAQLEGIPGDERGDQFAFAATAWEILFDGFPFEASTVGELRAAILRGPVDPVDADPRHVAALRRALAPDPATRHPSIDALLSTFSAALPAPG